MLRPRGRPFPNPHHHRCCQTLVAGECPLNLKTRRKRSREFASGRENGEGTNEETNGTNLSATSVRINGHERSERARGEDGRASPRADGRTDGRTDRGREGAGGSTCGRRRLCCVGISKYISPSFYIQGVWIDRGTGNRMEGAENDAPQFCSRSLCDILSARPATLYVLQTRSLPSSVLCSPLFGPRSNENCGMAPS